MRRALRCLAALAVAAALAGCGSTAGQGGQVAQLWVTRDHGAQVVLTASVPAGLTILQALDRKADIETRYGGRFVESINGVRGSLAAQRDWFYFLNGIEPDVGAADVTLHAGDVAWWDFRSWRTDMEQPVVVGVFPRPLTVGYGDVRRPVRIDAPPDAELQAAANALGKVLGASSGSRTPNVFALRVVDGAHGATLRASRGEANDSPVTFVLAGSPAAVAAAAQALARDPAIVRYRYEARFDEHGKVIG